MNRRAGLVLGMGLGAAVLSPGVAWAVPDSGPATGSTTETATGSTAAAVQPAAAQTRRSAGPGRSTPGTRPRPRPSAAQPEAAPALPDELPAMPTHRRAVRAVQAAPAAGTPVAESPVAQPRSALPAVTVELPPMPVEEGLSFTVSPEAITAAATEYVAAGGDPADNPRFFFGDLAVRSLDALAGADLPKDQIRTQLGNLAVSGYFGGVWLRDNLREAPAAVPAPTGTATAPAGLGVSALGIRLFDALSAGLTGLATSRAPWIVTTAARASVPVLLTLYGYNRGYLEFLLENPPAGVPSRLETLTCKGFLDCNSTAFPLEIANRYDTALGSLADPPSLPWREMKAWSTLLEGATGAGRFVWGLIAQAGAFSPASYNALVDLSSAYLMVSKAAVLSSMQAYAGGDAELGRSALRLQAGLWMWSGAYFGGLASDAPRGTIPTLVSG